MLMLGEDVASSLAAAEDSDGGPSHRPRHAMIVTCVVLAAGLGARALGRRASAVTTVQRSAAGTLLRPATGRGGNLARARAPTRVDAGVLLRI